MKKINKICRMFFTVIISFVIMGNAVNVNASAKTNACVTHGGTFRGDIKMSVSYNAKATDVFVPYGIKYGSTIYTGYFLTDGLYHTSYGYMKKTISSKERFVGTFTVKTGTYNSRYKTLRLSINGSIYGCTYGTAKPIYLVLKKGTVSKYIYIGKTNPTKCKHVTKYKKLSSAWHQKVTTCSITGTVISKHNYRHNKNCRLCR